ncbi:SAP domain-containing protein, partial [Tetragenococcus halophilus]
MERPEFHNINSYNEFSKYYWYRSELEKICKQLGIDNTGTKQELNYTIMEYFNGHIIKKKKSKPSITNIDKVHLDTPLLKCGWIYVNILDTFFESLFSKRIHSRECVI